MRTYAFCSHLDVSGKRERERRRVGGGGRGRTGSGAGPFLLKPSSSQAPQPGEQYHQLGTKHAGLEESGSGREWVGGSGRAGVGRSGWA